MGMSKLTRKNVHKICINNQGDKDALLECITRGGVALLNQVRECAPVCLIGYSNYHADGDKKIHINAGAKENRNEPLMTWRARVGDIPDLFIRSRPDNMITVNGWFFHPSGSAIGPLHLQCINRLCFSKTKMYRVGVLGIKGVTGDNGQKLAFFALNH